MVQQIHLRDLVNVLTPHLRNRTSRREFVLKSLGPDTPWLAELDWQGTTVEFTTMLVLHCLPAIGDSGQPCPLTRLLLSARGQCSGAPLAEIDRMLSALTEPAVVAG